jgi:2-C-methyl-D-erythritol 4-phosphate cytidylyltransferase
MDRSPPISEECNQERPNLVAPSATPVVLQNLNLLPATRILFAHMKIVVIIPAAGLGTRMASAGAKDRKTATSKQFVELRGTPVLVHTLQRFAGNSEVAEIYVALRQPEIGSFRERLERNAPEILKKKTVLLEGGESRQQSVANALAAVSASADDIVLVHDAVRPFVTDEIIHDVIVAAKKYGAAITGVPAIDTVKQVERTAEGAVVKATIPRERIVMAQTPQGFRYSVLKKAFDEASADGFIGTDEASLVERSGQQVAVVMGSPRNMKITAPADLELAEFFLGSSASR